MNIYYMTTGSHSGGDHSGGEWGVQEPQVLQIYKYIIGVNIL